jgi:Male sterility protein
MKSSILILLKINASRFAKLYTKIDQLLYTMSYFGLREWQFDNRNITRLSQVLKSQNVHQMEFDLSTVDWNRYFRNYMPGIRKFYLKENDEKLGALKARNKRQVENGIENFFF